MKLKRKFVALCVTTLLAGCAATYDSAEEKYQQGEINDARAQWTELAEQGDTRSMYRLFDTSGHKSESDWAWLAKAAELDHPQAKYQLGLHEVEQEEYQAGIDKIKQAAELGEFKAQQWLLNHSNEMQYWPSAERGDTGAMVKLGEHYKDSEDYALALKWFQRGAEKFDSQALFYMGVLNQYGYGVAVNHQEAVKWYKLGAEKGEDYAMFNLCVMYRDGTGVTKNSFKAREWCKKAHIQGVTLASVEYGRMLMWGIGGKEDLKLAKTILEPLANGNAHAATNLGTIYFDGLGVDKDYAKSYQYYQSAYKLDQSRTFASRRIAIMYEDGLGKTKDMKQAAKWYLNSAQQGDVYSSRQMGYLYKEGIGVQKDLVQSAKWFEVGANQDDRVSTYYLGLAYFEGSGVQKDINKAERYLLKAAEAGSTDAQFKLGYEYQSGEHFKKDLNKFFSWTQKAANQGDSVAQYNLSVGYSNGWGAKKNYAWAAYWRAKSADQGYEAAKTGMNNVLKHLNTYKATKTTKIYQSMDSSSKVIAKVAKGDLLYRLGTSSDWTEVVSAKGHSLGYVKTNTIKSSAAFNSNVRKSSVSTSSSPFPAKPAKVSGKTTCNTRCVNGTCWRTYDDGKKVKFQAKRKFNAFSGEFEWDSGGC